MADLGALPLSELVALGGRLRRAGQAASSMEEAAELVVQGLYDGLGSEQRDCVLVRFYTTAAVGDLPPDLRAFAQGVAGPEALSERTKCLTLLATVGDEPSWCDRQLSRGHRAVPLRSEQGVSELPMIAALLRQFGLATGELLEAGAERVLELDEKTYNVFYVPEALGSPYVPAQADFVVPYAVRSALGFGGMLPTGELYAVVMFTRTWVPEETAELFKVLALSVKLGVLPFAPGTVFRSELPEHPEPPLPRTPRRSELLALEQLLEVQERTSFEQASRLEVLHSLESRRLTQLRGLAEASAVLTSTLSLEQVVEHLADRARVLVGAADATVLLEDGALTPPPDGGRMAVPLLGRDGAVLGLVEVTGEHAFTAEDEAVLTQLARLASSSIENAREFAREHQVSAALQRSLLPELRDVAGLEVAARYLAASQHLGIGGDWYDVVQLAPDQVVLAVGDVVGHDLRAAKTMGQLRHALRAFALEDPSPGALLARCDLLMDALAPDEFATLLYLLVDPGTRTVRFASAGHPPPLLLAPGSAPRYLDVDPAPPVGYLAPSRYDEATVVLPAGGTLVMFTDGLVERRDAPLDHGLDVLAALLAGDAAATAPVEDLVALVGNGLAATGLDDDAVVMVVRLDN